VKGTEKTKRTKEMNGMDEMRLIGELAERVRNKRKEGAFKETDAYLAELEAKGKDGDEEATFELYEIFNEGLYKRKRDEAKATKWAGETKAVVEKKAESGDGMAMWRLMKKYIGGNDDWLAFFGEDWEALLKKWFERTEQFLTKQFKASPADFEQRERLATFYRYYEMSLVTKRSVCKKAIELWQEITDEAERAESAGEKAKFERDFVLRAEYELCWLLKFPNAREGLERLAKKGYLSAMNTLGNWLVIGLYDDEETRDREVGRGLAMLSEAAEKGCASAQLELGEQYFSKHDYRIKQDYEKALYWLRRWAHNKNRLIPYCSYMDTIDYEVLGKIAVCYRDGGGNVKDGKKAFEMLSALAKIQVYGSHNVQHWLAYCYIKGIGTTKDEAKAVSLYMKASKRSAVAQNSLGACFAYGTGVEKDYEKAFYWFSRATKRCEENALYNLGACYEHGRGVKKDFKKAEEYFRRAKKNGYVIKAKDIERLRKKGIIVE
jgi:TPR repeat protein